LWSVKKRLWGITSKVYKEGESEGLLQKPKKKTSGNFGVLAPKTEILAILAQAACFLAFVLSHERKNEGTVTQISQIAQILVSGFKFQGARACRIRSSSEALETRRADLCVGCYCFKFQYLYIQMICL